MAKLSREELYALVWDRPMTRLAKEFGLSDVALHKICRKHEIPTPPLGYWAKKAHGKPVTNTPLPKARGANSQYHLIESQGAVPNIPPKRTRLWKCCFSKTLYKGRNAIERMFCRLKDCRRIATRYDRIANNFLGAIHLVAAIMWWL